MNKPSANGDNGGRDASGRFTNGNPGGTGNPYAKKTAELRSAMIKAVSKKDIHLIVTKLIAEAKGGSVRAAELLFNRVFGAPVPVDVLEQLDHLEQKAIEIERAKEHEHE